MLFMITSSVYAQEHVINVPISQPRQLEVNAGGDVYKEELVNIILGEELEIKGGTADFTYSWRDDDNNTQNTKTITVTSFGNYYLTVTDAVNCSAKDSVRVLNSTSVKPSHHDDFFLLYPNPGTGQVSIMLYGYKHPVRIDVFSVNGELLMRKKIYPFSDKHLVEMDLSTLVKGIYFVKLVSKRKTVVSSVVLK